METDTLKPYVFHGIHLDIAGKEATGDCPFCGKDEKFSVDIKTSKWRCLICGANGNHQSFLEQFWEACRANDVPYGELAFDRGIDISTLKAWGVVKSILTGEWLVPGYNTKGKIWQLYRYSKTPKGMKLLATPTLSHQIHGVNLYNPRNQVVYLCEGPWDAMKLWEVLGKTKETKEGFASTSSTKVNLLKGANVLAVPGCSTFNDSWCDVFRGKRVYIVYDNDHPKKHPKTGKLIPPAGYKGVERVSGILGAARTKPQEVKFLRWGQGGYDKDLADGTDVRDVLKNGDSIKQLRLLFNKFQPVPKGWLENGKKKEVKRIESKECTKWLVLSNKWRKALRWTDGLDTTLSVMLASIASTNIMGDQLWIKVIGPASCGKSTLCEAVSVCKKYVLAKSTIRGFHSGFKTGEGGDEEDNSLIIQAAGKCLVTKDGDTLLQSPNLAQVLSEARDIYDCTSRTHYRNKMSKEYEGIRMTWLLCGTSSLRSIDSSELGERFLDCVIMEGIDDELEDEVLLRVAEREDRNMSGGLNEDQNQHDPSLQQAMELTGGYVQYLRENAEQLLEGIITPRESLIRITRLGKFVAFMRARPSLRQEENAEREFGARLVSQHLRLAKCLAMVLNRKTVDGEVMRRVRKVALDTSRGLTLDICLLLHEEHQEGTDVKLISLVTSQTEDTTRKLLRFLSAIGVVEQFQKKSQGVRAKKKWRLTAKLFQLYNEVLEVE